MREGTFMIASTGLVMLVVALTIAAPFTGVGTPRGESQYTGHVVDVVEDKGIVMKPSWVNMKTSPRSSDIQQYCILPEDEQLVEEFYGAMEQGDRMTVTYSRPLWVNPFDCKSDQAVIRDLRPANTTQEETA